MNEVNENRKMSVKRSVVETREGNHNNDHKGQYEIRLQTTAEFGLRVCVRKRTDL